MNATVVKSGAQREMMDVSTSLERTKHGYTSPACTVQLDDDEDSNTTIRSFNRIYFLHMRKAGGTSFRAYFRSVSKRKNVSLVAAEGISYQVQFPIRCT